MFCFIGDRLQKNVLFSYCLCFTYSEISSHNSNQVLGATCILLIVLMRNDLCILKKKNPSLLEDINKGDPMFSAMQFGALCDWLM